MENDNVEALRALIMQVIQDLPAPAPVQVQPRTYVKTNVRVQNLMQEIVENDVIYKEAINTRKQADVTAASARARIEELLVESRKLKVPQALIGEALGISSGSVSSRMATARKSVRNRKKTK